VTKVYIKKKPLISIVIPVYNEEKYLNYCLSTLSNQSYSNKEIIIVDDGSTDKSIDICKRYKAALLKQVHQGAGAARNLGVSKSKGEIIILADADMRYDKDYIKKLIEPILAKRAIGTFIKQEYVANPENIWSRCWNINSNLPPNRRIPENYPNTENVFRAILKSYFIKGHGYETNDGYSDDSSLSKKIKKVAVNAPDAISFHYNPSSLIEIFYSSRWIGRSILFKPNLVTFLRYSPLNSLRISLNYIIKGAPWAIIPFKLTYDFGMFVGIFLNHGKRSK
jgi:glycosyltransferase involved in cell wall biosynthesis